MDYKSIAILNQSTNKKPYIPINELTQELSPNYNITIKNVDFSSKYTLENYDIIIILINSLEQFKLLTSWKSLNALTVTAYFLEREEFDNPQLIEYLDILEEKEFNIIFSDNKTSKTVYPSLEKIIDAIYCKSVKTKYLSNRLSNFIDYNTDEFLRIRKIFNEVSSFLKGYDLNPSPNDGLIAVRSENCFYITSSNTYKYDVPEDRIVKIVSYIDKENQVSWEGYNKPSSETPCAALVFRHFANINILVHFHFKSFTYSPQLESFRSPEYIQYGTLDEANALTNQLKKTNQFAILRGHGEFLAVNNINDLDIKLHDVKKHLSIKC